MTATLNAANRAQFAVIDIIRRTQGDVAGALGNSRSPMSQSDTNVEVTIRRYLIASLIVAPKDYGIVTQVTRSAPHSPPLYNCAA